MAVEDFDPEKDASPTEADRQTVVPGYEQQLAAVGPLRGVQPDPDPRDWTEIHGVTL